MSSCGRNWTVVHLTPHRPPDHSDFLTTSRFLWHGAFHGLRDCWVDKPVQLIVFGSARAGLMGEHSVMDGTPTLALTDAICNALADPTFDHGSSPSSPLSSSAPVELKWTLDSALEQSIARAEKDAAELIKTQAMSVIKTGYGKRAIKAARVSPDAWAQLTYLYNWHMRGFGMLWHCVYHRLRLYVKCKLLCLCMRNDFSLVFETGRPLWGCNEEFAAEISRAGADLYMLYSPGEQVPKSRL
ncbi:Choline/Carnitine o-acyltransferase-domain-containing protein [Russula aff. rugulosa BPL654]|nr:Choline/Carnitine o-acyltransferase-domain-containing protein [Russula aff. rugulosa BPL654]